MPESSIAVSAETKKIIEELLWVFGLPDGCTMISSPDVLRIENDNRGHNLEIKVKK